MEKYNFDKNTKRMIEGKLYKGWTNDESPKRKKIMREFNAYLGEPAEVMHLARQVFGSTKETFYVESPMFLDHGWNVHVGENFYANTGLIILDQCPVNIGDNVMMGPRVSLYCATHPIDALVRNLYVEAGKPITIGNDVWIGGDTTVLPGVTIGNNIVVGAGSVVTKDLEDGGIYAGNPAKLIRKITKKDKDYWLEQLKEYEEDMNVKLK